MLAITSDKLPWYQSIRWRLALSYIALSIVPLFVFNFTIMAFIQNYFQTDRQHETLQRAHIVSDIATGFTFDVLNRDNASLGLFRSQVRQRSDEWGVRIIVTDHYARIIGDSNLARLGQTLLNS